MFLPLDEKEYLFDTFINLEKDGRKQISLAFRKLVWFQSMRFANNLFTEVIYDQVLMINTLLNIFFITLTLYQLLSQLV